MKLLVRTPAHRQLAADMALLSVTMIWGVTFVVIKNALTDIGPFYFISIRFLLAFATLAIIYSRRLIRGWRENIGTAALIGMVLFAGYALQTIGLQYTTAANSGFITGLSVVLVPIIGIWWGQKSPGLATWAGIVSVTVGLGLLTLDDTFRLNHGDFITLVSAMALGCHIVMVGHYAPRGDAVVLAVLQIGAVGVFGTIGGVLFEAAPHQLTGAVWLALAVTAIPATAFALLIQNLAQRFTTAARTALIFAMEPVFAGVAAYLLLGEVLTIKQLAGCALIVLGMVISELNR